METGIRFQPTDIGYQIFKKLSTLSATFSQLFFIIQQEFVAHPADNKYRAKELNVVSIICSDARNSLL